MGRYCDGDAGAVRKLYALVAPRLLHYAMCLVGDRQTAEDALQTTFLKLHHARTAYLRGADPIPWLYTITHRVCLDELRRAKRSHVRLTHDGTQLPEVIADLRGAPDSGEPDAETRELYTLTLAALEQLPPNQREALVLTKLHGRSMIEAATITGSTPGAIKLRAHRAYVTLRKLLGATKESA